MAKIENIKAHDILRLPRAKYRPKPILLTVEEITPYILTVASEGGNQWHLNVRDLAQYEHIPVGKSAK